MPRKKIVPDEEQVNEIESQVTEEAVEGLEQSVTDLPQEDVSPPVTEEPPPPPPPPPAKAHRNMKPFHNKEDQPLWAGPLPLLSQA